MATKAAGEALEKLKYQTWILKVQIHCEGCKKKVKRILQGVDGVYKTEIDAQQHKVTVTGNVEAQTLIKRLLRSRKHAEVWPDHLQEEKKITGKSKNNDKRKENKDKKQKENKDGGNENGDDTQPQESHESDQDVGTEKENAAAATADGANGGSGGKKKKKKKKGSQSGNSNTGGAGGDPSGEPAASEDAIEVGLPVAKVDSAKPAPSVNHSPAIQHLYPYPYPPMYHPPPVYGVSYNAAHRSPTESYYAYDPMHVPFLSQPLQRYHPPAPPSDPIYAHGGDYNDEGGCSVM